MNTFSKIFYVLVLVASAQIGSSGQNRSGKPDAQPGAVFGTAVDAKSGDRLKGVRISLRSNTEEVLQTVTNANGAFEFRNVKPGSYFFSTQKYGYLPGVFGNEQNGIAVVVGAGQEIKDAKVRLLPAAVFAGSVVDQDDEPLAGVKVVAIQKYYTEGRIGLLESPPVITNDLGHFRIANLWPGRYYLRATRTTRPFEAAGHYAPVFYPNSTGMDDAQALKVTAAEEILGIGLVLREAPTFSVSGTIKDSRSGQLVPSAYIGVYPDGPAVGGSETGGQAQPDGSFRMTDLVPGRYRLIISNPDSASPGKLESTARSFVMPDHNVSGMAIIIGGSTLIKSRIVALGGDLTENLQMTLTNDSGKETRANRVATDGSYEVPGLQPGVYEVKVSSGPFFLSNVRVDGRDSADSSIVVPDGQLSIAVTVTIDFRVGTISGKAFDAANNPLTKDVSVVLVSADPAKRGQSRYFRKGSVDTAGTFKISEIVPGDYLMLAWPRYPDRLIDPDILELVEKYAVRVSVSVGVSSVGSVKLTPEVQTVAESILR